MWGWICNIPSDKALHFIAGLLVVALAATTLPSVANWAIVFALVAGVGKEIRDQIVYGGFDWKDLVATIAGGAVMQMFIWFGL
jgi:hypothetical protein